jgi:hypothetical protein
MQESHFISEDGVGLHQQIFDHATIKVVRVEGRHDPTALAELRTWNRIRFEEQEQSMTFPGQTARSRGPVCISTNPGNVR